MRTSAPMVGRARRKASDVTFGKISAYVRESVNRLLAVHQRAASQRALRLLEPHILRDIGVDPVEIGKPPSEIDERSIRIKMKTLF